MRYQCFARAIVSLGLTFPFVGVSKIPPEKLTYIKKKYELTLFDKQHLFYPATQAKRLVIIFTGAQKNKYAMWSWFWNDEENWKDTAYLFLKDDDFCWYIGNNKKSFIEDYSKIIVHYISAAGLQANQAIAVGSSMGAYGAVLYACLLGLKGAIALNPQVNKTSNEIARYAIQNTEDRWIDLDRFVSSCEQVPCISLIFTYNICDEAASYALIDALKVKAQLLIVRRFPSPHHYVAPLVFSKNFLTEEINYFENSTRFMATKSFVAEERDNEFDLV
jgi:hypothetical protein